VSTRVARRAAASAPALPIAEVELSAAPMAVALRPRAVARARPCHQCSA